MDGFGQHISSMERFDEELADAPVDRKLVAGTLTIQVRDHHKCYSLF